MIPFFRKLRKQFADDNKPAKYFRYAIGEIILVVIGILIALQINNWNSDRINLKESNQFKIRLLNEVKSNIQIITSEIEDEKAIINANLSILNMFHVNKENQNARTLDSLIYIGMIHNQAKLNLGTLNEGLNTGKISLIESDSLRSLLYDFPTLVENMISREKYNNDDIDYFFTPFLYDHLSFRQMDGVHSRYKDQIGSSKFMDYNNLEILQSMKFENLIDNRYYNSNGQMETYEEIRINLERLKRLIDASLK